jgi:hypothetical protein
VLLVAIAACKSHSPRSPTKLRQSYAAALAKNDAKAAYRLLAPEVRKQLSYAEFERRWKAQTTERKAAAKAASNVKVEPVLEGTTVHEGGRVLRWTEVGGRYYVVSGLPGSPQTATPAQTIRALIAAVRTTDLTRVRSLLGDELADAIGEDWQARVEAMEAALDRPGAIELSADLRRAELRYEQGRVLTLEQTPRGWRITTLE